MMAAIEAAKTNMTKEEEDAVHRAEIEGNLAAMKAEGGVIRTVPKDDFDEEHESSNKGAENEKIRSESEPPKEAIIVQAEVHKAPNPPPLPDAPRQPEQPKKQQVQDSGYQLAGKGRATTWGKKKVPQFKGAVLQDQTPRRFVSRAKPVTTAYQAKNIFKRDTDQSASESSDNQEGRQAALTDKDLSYFGQKITSSKGVAEAVNQICQEKGIEMKRQWVNDLDAKRISGAPITDYIVGVFLSGIQMERAHSLTDQLEQSIGKLSDQVSKLLGVTKSYQQENKNLQAAISRQEGVSKDYMVKTETLLEEYRSSLLDSLAPSEEFRRTAPKKEKEIAKSVKKEQETPGAAIELSELDDDQLVMVFLNEIGAMISDPEDTEIVIASVVSNWNREELEEIILGGPDHETRRLLKIEVKRAIKRYTEGEDEKPAQQAPVIQHPSKSKAKSSVNWYD